MQPGVNMKSLLSLILFSTLWDFGDLRVYSSPLSAI